jgi:hypothetical protein
MISISFKNPADMKGASLEFIYNISPSSSHIYRWKTHRLDGCSIESKNFLKVFSHAHGQILPLFNMKLKQTPNYIRHHFKGAENIGDII